MTKPTLIEEIMGAGQIPDFQEVFKPDEVVMSRYFMDYETSAISPARVRQFQDWARAHGFISPRATVKNGMLDEPTRAAFASLQEIGYYHGFARFDISGVMSEVEGGGVSGTEEDVAPFVPPKRRIASDDDIREIAQTAAQELLGMGADEGAIQDIISQYRRQEESAYQADLTQSRRQYDAAAVGQAPPSQPVTQVEPAQPASIAASQFRKTEEGRSFTVARGVMDLIQALRTGSL